MTIRLRVEKPILFKVNGTVLESTKKGLIVRVTSKDKTFSKIEKIDRKKYQFHKDPQYIPMNITLSYATRDALMDKYENKDYNSPYDAFDSKNNSTIFRLNTDEKKEAVLKRLEQAVLKENEIEK